jgi:competence protein ComEA
MNISKLTSILLSALLVAGLSSISVAQETSANESGHLTSQHYPVDINSADAQQLASSLQGVGSARAAAIVAYRQEHGAFESVEDLLQVSGIGESTLEANRSILTVGNRD